MSEKRAVVAGDLNYVDTYDDDWVAGFFDSESSDYPGTGITNFMVEVINNRLYKLIGKKLTPNIINRQDNNGNTALHYLLTSNENFDKLQMLKFVTNFDPDLDLPNNNGITVRQLLYDLSLIDKRYEYFIADTYYDSGIIPSDILDSILLYLDYNDIITLCNTSYKFSKKYCNNPNNYIWINMYIRDISEDISSVKDFKDTYYTLMKIYIQITLSLINLELDLKFIRDRVIFLMKNRAHKLVNNLYQKYGNGHLSIFKDFSVVKESIIYQFNYIAKDYIKSYLFDMEYYNSLNILAAENNNIEMVSFLINKGASNINEIRKIATRENNTTLLSILPPP